jgi:glycosyltransferase involved in cell wall biosynthesis
MKIGFATPVIQRGKTGVAQYVFALLRALLPQTDRHQFYLFVLEEDLPLFEFVQGRMHLVPVAEKFRPAVKNILWHQLQLPGLVRQLGLDVLHVPSYRRLLWRKPCPLVATIHDLAPFHVTGKYDWKRMLYGRVVVKRLAARQDEIIAVSENTARDLQACFGLGRDRVTVIWNGLDHARFQPGDPAAAKARAAARWRLDRPFFLYVSRLEHPGKNHVRLIAAFNQFKAATQSDWLLAFGGSDWHGAEAIHAAAKASPYAADIRQLGFVDDPSLPELYQATDVFIYPSLFEGFGFPPLEAMACGCPVISSTRGSLREVVGEAALTIDPEDPPAMAAALTRLAADPGERARWRAAGLLHARRFDWAQNAGQTLALYQRAADKHRKQK